MDRNTLLAFFLIALVLLFTPKYMEIFAPQPATVETTPHENQKENKLDTLLATKPQTSQLKNQRKTTKTKRSILAFKRPSLEKWNIGETGKKRKTTKNMESRENRKPQKYTKTHQTFVILFFFHPLVSSSYCLTRQDQVGKLSFNFAPLGSN